MKEGFLGKFLFLWGNSTLEILVSFAILTLSMSAVILLAFSNQSLSIDAQINAEAIQKTRTLLENARSASRFDFNTVNSATSTETSGPLTYTSALDVRQLDIFRKQATSTISWEESGRTLKVSLSTILTNINALNGGDTCSSILSGNWTNPQIREYEFGKDILNDSSSGFPISFIQAFNKKLYVTVNNDSGNNPGTFFILDINNPEMNPILLSPPDFDNSAVGPGLSSVAIDNKGYAYVTSAYASANSSCAENHNCAQLQIIDILDPTNPTIIKNVKIPALAASNRLPAGNKIVYSRGYLYVGLAKTAAGSPRGEFNIIDVGGGGASPTHPELKGTFTIGSGINDIIVQGNYAYVASPDNAEELKVLDISNPNTISLVGSFNAPGGGGNNGNGKSLAIVGDKIYLGRTLLNGNEFYILDNSNPRSNHTPALGKQEIGRSINGITIRESLAFLLTNGELQIWKIDNPDSISQHASSLTLPPGSGGGLTGTALDCEGNYLFVGSKGSSDKGYISIVTSSP